MQQTDEIFIRRVRFLINQLETDRFGEAYELAYAYLDWVEANKDVLLFKAYKSFLRIIEDYRLGSRIYDFQYIAFIAERIIARV